MISLKQVSLAILIIGYTAAGINHFVHPAGYLRIIPSYIPWPIFINYASGTIEILLGSMLIAKITRRMAVYGICLMLIAFLPVHIQMLIDAPLQLNTFTITPLVAWIRLLLQPVLVAWVWWHKTPPGFPEGEEK